MFLGFVFLVFLVGVVFADNETGQNQTQQNQTQNNSEQNQTQENQTVTCEEDEDCDEGYKCEESVCVLDNGNETEENETEVDEEKVCCYRYRERNGTREGEKYNSIERGDCLNYGDENNGVTHFGEVVNDSMCEGRHRERWEINKRAQEIFEGRSGIECPDDCFCRGSVISCELEDGSTEMTVYAGRSENVIIHIKGVNVTTNVTVYQDENGSLLGGFENGERRIRVLPDEAKFKFKEKIKSRYYEEETEIELEENGEYKIKTKKEARFLGLFKVREKIEGEVDSETGDVRIHNPWWGWLANDVEE